MHTVILIIGSNIHPEENIRRALELLRARVTVRELSSIWETEPVGTTGAVFLNMAARIETDLKAEELKWQVLREIEKQLGRVRSADKYAPRQIDLDIVLFDGNVLDSGLWERGYLALTVAELEPDLVDPRSGETLSKTARRLHHTYRAVRLSDRFEGI